MLRANTAGAAYIHRTHDQQLDAVDVLGVLFGDVGHVGVQLVEPVGIGSAGTLLHQSAHFADGDDGIYFFLAQAQGQTQIGIRVYVGGEDGASLVGIEPGQGGGKGGFTHATLAGDR